MSELLKHDDWGAVYALLLAGVVCVALFLLAVTVSDVTEALACPCAVEGAE